MKLTLILFGITKEITGHKTLDYQVSDHTNVQSLKKLLQNDYPKLGKLTSLAIAINGSYAENTRKINANDEIVLIPPVSGG